MAKVVRFCSDAGSLSARQPITVELPVFAIRALQYRMEEVNESAASDEVVDLNHVIEWCVISPLSVKEMPHLEAAVPGFTAAFTKWLFESMYQPPE